jgi:3-hydroxyacyl-CoA dehydrogenase
MDKTVPHQPTALVYRRYNIAVVGAGLMGHGIAQEFALAGYEVRLQDLTKEHLQQAMVSIRANLERLVGLGLISRQQADAVPGHIRASTRLDEVPRMQTW